MKRRKLKDKKIQSDREAIIEESRRFVNENKGTTIDEDNSRAHSYGSPRISSEFMDLLCQEN